MPGRPMVVHANELRAGFVHHNLGMSLIANGRQMG
jgi:hypothetical protein